MDLWTNTQTSATAGTYSLISGTMHMQQCKVSGIRLCVLAVVGARDFFGGYTYSTKCCKCVYCPIVCTLTHRLDMICLWSRVHFICCLHWHSHFVCGRSGLVRFHSSLVGMLTLMAFERRMQPNTCSVQVVAHSVLMTHAFAACTCACTCTCPVNI